MLFITVVINYLDRSNLSIAMPHIADEFDLTPQLQGLLLSAFGWSYAILQIPGGWLIDKIKPRYLYPVCLILWSLATVFMGVIGGFVALIILRLMIGAFEAPAYPINTRVAATWFPEKERGRVIGLYTSGQFIGLALLTPVLTWLQNTFTWHWVFVASGAVGIIWGVVWFLVYRDPKENKHTNDAEIDYIRDGGGVPDISDNQDKKTRTKFSWSDLRAVASSKKLWGAYIGQFCLLSTTWFFLTWFPSYLVNYRGLDVIESGFFVSLPYVGAFVGVVLAGWLSDYMLKRGAALSTARKGPIIAGLVLSIAILGANFTDSIVWITVFMSIAFFGNGFASITWSLVSSIAPVRLMGTTGGMFNFIGNISSIATPIIIGFLVSSTNFAPALTYITIVTAIGIVAFIALIGKVERMPDPQDAKHETADHA
jgi:ACS family D-galactonate transporter-like MFS transporter